MKLPFNPFRKRRPSEPPAARVELRRSHPRTQMQRRDAVYPPPEPPAPAPKPTPSNEPAARPQHPPTPPRQPRTRNKATNPRAVRGYGRRSAPPPEPPTQRDPNRPPLKSEAELRHEIGPTMQYDDPT